MEPIDTKWKTWWRLLSPYAATIAVLLLFQALQSTAALILPSLSADVIDRGILHADRARILHSGGLMLLAAATQLGFSVAASWLGARIAMGVGHDLRLAVFAQVQQFSLHELRQFGAPSLITRTSNDVQQLQSVLTMVLTMIVIAPIMGIGGIVMAMRTDTHLSLLLVVSVPLLVAVVTTIMWRALPLFARMQTQVDRVNQVLREQINGLRVIRAFVRDDHERGRFAETNDALATTALRVGRLMALNMPAANVVMQLSSVALLWLGAQRIREGGVEVGSLVAFLSYIAQILMSVMMASMLFAVAPRALVSGRRIREVLTTASSVTEPDKPVTLPASAQQRGEIEFRKVGFAYPGAESPVLRDIDFRVGPGQTVGIIGPTGSGKSTVVNLIVRLFDVSSGSVRVAGTDVRELQLETLWSLIGLVPQESYLFSGTIADNLRYGCTDADDDALWHALEVAQAKDFVTALPDGLQAPVAQGGGNFSGGQRQRLAIARALVRKPAVYLFDDSFSALDYATDARLRAALARETGDAATLIVGQRVASLRHADMILVLEQGRIVGAGSHEQLLADCEAYREIVASQQTAEVSA